MIPAAPVKPNGQLGSPEPDRFMLLVNL